MIMHKPNWVKVRFFGLIVLAGAILWSCADDKTSLYNPNYEAPRPAAELLSITPASGWLAGVASITVQGRNFVTDTSQIRIYFDGKRGTILRATTTELEVIPNSEAVGDSVQVKVMVLGAELFSNVIKYKLSPPLVTPSPDIKNTDLITSNTTDANGDIYLHVVRDGASIGIQKIDMDVAERPMSQVIAPVPRSIFNDLKVGKDGKLISIQAGARALFVYEIGTSTKWNPTYVGSKSSSTFNEFIFDDNNHIWVVGKAPAISRFDYDNPTNRQFFDFGHNLTAVAYYNDKLYVGGTIDGELQVYTYDTDATGNLSNGTSFYKLSNFPNYTAEQINCMTIASDGTVYIGIDSPVQSVVVDGKTNYFTENGIIQIAPDGKSASYLYPGVTPGNIVFMFWGDGELLNIVRGKVNTDVGTETILVQQQNMYLLNMLDKRRAPYYGE